MYVASNFADERGEGRGWAMGRIGGKRGKKKEGGKGRGRKGVSMGMMYDV